jgi:hypothetical protein
MTVKQEHSRVVRILALGCLVLPPLYFGSLGPAQVLCNRACYGLDLGSNSDSALRWRYNNALKLYSRPAFAAMSKLAPLRRAGAQYVRWWLKVTNTSPRCTSSEEFWYDSDS